MSEQTQDTLDTNETVGMPPLEELPMDRPVKGVITAVDYRLRMYMGKPAYMTDKDTKEQILDKDGHPIPLKEFNITISIPEFTMPNGEARKTWISLGASLGENAKLPKFLARFGIKFDGGIKAKEIIDALLMKELTFILAFKNEESKYQTPVLETVKHAK